MFVDAVVSGLGRTLDPMEGNDRLGCLVPKLPSALCFLTTWLYRR